VLYVFHGEDQFRAREALAALRRELDTDGNLRHNTNRYNREDTRSLTPGELRAACHAASFFVEARLVIVEGLLSRFSGASGRRGRAGRRTNGNSGSGVFEQFLDVLDALPETTTVVLLEEASPPKTFLDGIPGDAVVREFKTLRKQDVRPWATKRAREQGADISPRALDRLASMFDGNHLGELAGELDKLTTYALGRTITVQDVDELVAGATDQMVWDLTDAIIEGRTDRALAVLRQMTISGSRPPQVLTFMIVRQYRQLLLAQAMLQDGLAMSQIAAETGVRSEYPLKKLMERAGSYPAAVLEQAYRQLLESDVAVKTGVLDAQPALEMLVVSLSELAKSPTNDSRLAPVRH
jgi:DNA polymerase III subunit delta